MQDREFKLFPSHFYCLFLALMLLGSAVIALMLPVQFWLRTLIFAVLIVYGAQIFWRYAWLRSKNSVIKLINLTGKRWELTIHGETVEGILRGDSTITTVVSVLRFDISGSRWPLSCMVFRDSLRGDDYRRLISTIRMG
jgi:hypothetical protein